MAFDAFLKIDGIDGESRVIGREKHIEVHSYSFGVQNAGSTGAGGGGAAAGKADFTDVSFVISQSTATVPLLLAVASGTHYPAATLSLVSGGEKPVEFYEMKMSDIVVTSFHEAASAVDDRPSNAFSLAFGKIQWTYREQGPKGELGKETSGGWDGTKMTN